MDARTQARCRQCGNSSGGVQGAVNQFGESYGSQGGIVTIPDYGPNPVVNIQGDGVNGATADQVPYIVIQDPNDPYNFTIRWVGTQVGRSLVAADGATVLYTAPAEAPLVINGANQQGTPRTLGGLTVTPNGNEGHNPTIVLAINQDNPPFLINDDGEIESADAASQSCFGFTTEEIAWADGPGHPDAGTNAADFVVDDKATFACITGTPFGALRTYVIDQDDLGDWQWRGPV